MTPPLSAFTGLDDVYDPQALLSSAKYLKSHSANEQLGAGKTLVLLFFNPSLRTRLSTQKAAQALGMHVISMNVGEGWKLEMEDGAVMRLDKAEHVRDAAAVIGQYADIIGVRSFPTLTDRDADYREAVIGAFRRYSGKPVLSLESATRHPLQALADWLTISEHQRSTRPKVVLTWAPHPKILPQAVANSFVTWMRMADVDLTVTHPPGVDLAPEMIKDTPVVHDQAEALADADFVYAKNWSSYSNYGNTTEVAEAWQITEVKMRLTDNAYFMHCLPVRRNVVVSDGVLDGPRSLVLAQANNRTHAAQAVLTGLLGVTIG